MLQLARAAEPVSLRVMTYNLRYASNSPPNSWPQRRPAAKALIEETKPDLVGTQEGLYGQLVELAGDLPEHRWLGLGREGGSHGEFMAVFYRADRFEPLEYDHFWLSDTPQLIGSSSWGNSVRRMVTWVRFRDRQAGRELHLVNTHFDHMSQPSREKSAEAVWAHISALPAETLVVLLGDFNAAAEQNPCYATLAGPERLQDAWLLASQRGPDVGTFHNYRGPKPGARIDWILLRGPWQVQRAEVVTLSREGQYPSDHFPVLAELVWPATTP